MNVLQTWSTWKILVFFAPKVFFAVLCGGMIGLERELKNKSAGIKTNILICLGSTLFTCASQLVAASTEGSGFHSDPGRIAAQIVSGIGFLGGGAILQSQGAVVGLTTAATIWVVAAIGLCIGLGYADLGVATSVIVLVVLVAIHVFEIHILRRNSPYVCEVTALDADGSVRERIQKTLQESNLTMSDFDLVTRDGLCALTLRYTGRREDHRKFILTLWNIPGIQDVRQS